MPTRETDQERDASVTVRLDRWASILRNCSQEDFLGLTDDELSDLSTLLTQAANEICRLSAAPRELRTWMEAWVEENLDGNEHPLGAYREGKNFAWRTALNKLNQLVPPS